MPATIGLATAALLFALVLAFPAGIIAGLRRGSWVDTACMGVALVGQSVPVFWLGLMLILLFSVNLKWLPTGGTGGLDHLILPMITLGLFSMARTARLVRSGMIEVMQNDFIRTARAKGLTEQAIVQRHALRFALIPLVTVIGLDLATLLGGAVITETIFSWPGVGRLVVDSIRSRDYPVRHRLRLDQSPGGRALCLPQPDSAIQLTTDHDPLSVSRRFNGVGCAGSRTPGSH
jgi:peptide/nickel transport system permease protein